MPNTEPLPGSGTTLSVKELFEEVVLKAVRSTADLAKPPSSPPHDFADRVRWAEEFAAREFTGLLRGAEALVQGLPRDHTECDSGPICELRHYAALAWAISHFGDMLYREARAAAGPATEGHRHPLDPPGAAPRHPLDMFTQRLGVYLDRLRQDGRDGRYRAHGWLGADSVDLARGWFVEGNIGFDALGNSVVMRDGRHITGFEARWTEPNPAAIDDAANNNSGDDDDDDGEIAGPPSAAVQWMRTAEAKAWLKEGSPKLKKKAEVEACRLDLKIARPVAARAFDEAVPPDRRRNRGGQKE